ncbi:putative non-ribosomal peptide synthetase [Rosellinia necatrix]|uniref:Putative non-ribosomal peptide synthetase n=1 Tax=Rosellinia necatrix TaxID=77044 RepID=A0A1W2TFE1_ROSNE|nr:putative non-ribosomal peptide synthetase [Rosellinia necatrix]
MSLPGPGSPRADGLSILNAEPRRLPGPCLLHQLIPPTGNNGRSTAIDFLSKNGRHIMLSYPELHTTSLALAHTISSALRSVQPSPPSTAGFQGPLIIPILSPQSPQLYVAILAVLKAGGAFCPLSIEAPPDRVRFILEDVEAKVVLVNRNLASRLPADDNKYKIVFIDDVLDVSETGGDSLATVCPDPRAEDLSYVMYTSGSTGTPKGVAVSHLAATQSLLAHDRHVPPFSRFLQFAAPTFDVSIFEIFFPLFRGATLVGCDRAEMLTDLAGILNKMEIDACELTPSVAGSLLKQRSRAPGLKLLLTIGEMLTEPVIREFGGDECKTSILWGMYGPTEATIHCTLQPAFEAASKGSTIGVPFDTVSAFVVRISAEHTAASQFEVLPIGEVGELALGGLQLAACYVNRPDQTAMSFVNTAWGRVYKTGDKAVIRPDGIIECLGRIDESQVKLNGQRLELREIEQVLLRVLGCHGAVAAVISNTLIAFVSMEQSSCSSAQLWDQCRSWLPAYMVPTNIVVTQQLPRLSSGKIDKKRLIDDYTSQTKAAFEAERAVDDRERLLCDVATTILNEQVGPLTQFSAARLDSLAAIEYASTLREKGIRNISPIDVLSVRTPRELRQKIEDSVMPVPIQDTENQSTNNQPFDPQQSKLKLESILGDRINEIDRIESPTPLQQSMIAETLKNPELYMNQIEFELASHVTVDVLLSSLKRLTECNEILRTGFAFVEAQICQVIWKRVDDIQFYENVDGGDHTGEVADVELFLRHPLRIEIRRPTLEEEHYTMLLTLHHAIYDGWTIDLMIEDLTMLLGGSAPTKRPQFSQVMKNLQENLKYAIKDSVEFWAEHLHGAGAVATTGFKTVAVPKPERVSITTKMPLHPNNLKDIMGRVSVGPQVLFQSCLVWLWATIQGVDDVTIGSVSSGRSFPLDGIDKLMGPCITTLPLRVNISRYRTIIELLQSIHSTNREALWHGHVPLSKIYQTAGVSNGSKLFDVIFAYQESPASRRQNSSIIREIRHRDATEANLLVEIQPRGDHYVCQTTFRTDALSQSLVEAFTHHLGYLVGYFNTHLDAPIETIHHYFPFDSLSHFNENPTLVETCSSLSEMVEQSASKFSSAPALHFATSISQGKMNSQFLSYHELNSKANRIARHLQQCGPAHGGVIAIIMEKSPLLYSSILAILKLGRAYLPILPSTPLERVKIILSQAEPSLCVVDTGSSSIIFDKESPTTIDIEIADISAYSDANLGIRGSSSELAYVIYTSGTTGTPKGVAVTNENILSNINILSDIYPHQSSDRMLQACSQAFDVSVFEIFFAWANGMCLCAGVNDTLFEDLEQTVRAFEITHLNVTVTVASLLNPENVPTVKFLATSGEPMTDEVLDRWSQYLYQGYGPSETTNICTVRKVFLGDSPQFLGHAFQNTSTFVLHPSSTQLVPVGCIGELCFGGYQVASRYLKLPEITAARFIDHEKYGRLYRSGDLGRMLPDGSLIIHGRIDTQVKLRGMRIELQEIQAIASKTGLTQSCRSVLLTQKDAKRQHIAFFYVARGHESTGFQLLPLTSDSREQTRTFWYAFQSGLPDYMIPAFVFPITSLPLTSSGKVDESALRRFAGSLSTHTLNTYAYAEDQIDVRPDWSKTEMLVVNMIADILKKDIRAINRWTSFSALGLDSISAMPLARSLQSALGKRIPLSLILQHPNISRLAAAVDELELVSEPLHSSASLLPQELVETMQKRFTAKDRSVTKVLPCTPLQEVMVMSSFNPTPTSGDGVAYYNQMLFHLRVPYTEFVSLQEQASRHIASVSSMIGSDRPPIALAIIRTKESGEYLSFVCHHAMYDGISMRIILSEIEALYHGRHLPKPPSLEPFIRETQLSHPLQDSFWEQLFQGLQPVSLKCKNFTKDAMPGSISASASKMSLKLIESRLQDIGVSMLSLVQAVWAITLSVLSQRSDISFGSVVAGRSIPVDMVDHLVAPCFNTLPIRMDLSSSTFLLDVMKGFQNLHAKVMLHQFTGLRRIQRVVNTETSLFDTLIILQPPTTPLDDALWSLEYEDGFMGIPIICEVIPCSLNDTLTMQLHRDRSKFTYDTLQLVGNIFSHILDASLRYPSSHIFRSEQLPSDWQTDIGKLFYIESSQTLGALPNQAPSYDDEVWSPSESTIRQTLARFTEVPEDQIKRLTPIYRYGLDSITAIQFIAILRQQNIFISLVDALEQPTCAGIAATIGRDIEDDFSGSYEFSSFQNQVGTEIRSCDIDLATVEAILPCTATQQGLLSQFLDSKGKYYFNYTSWTLDTTASPERTLWAWSQLADHHQILRTGFVPVDHPDSSFAMLVYCGDSFTAPVEIYEADAFDVDKWRLDATADALHALVRPPWRLALVPLKSADSEASLTMHLAIHHTLYDAFTLQNLQHDINRLISDGVKPEVTSIDRALSHYLGLVESAQSAGQEFWKEKAKTFAFHKFPVMTPLQVNSSDSLILSRTFETPSSSIRQAASECCITVQAALQGAWARLLSAYIGEPRVTFGVVFDGRTTQFARQVTLPMITTLPVIAENVASNAELVHQMMEYNRELRRLQHMPITQIQRALGVTGALFDTIMIYQAVDKTVEPPPLRVIKEVASVEYPISLEIEETYSNTTQLNLGFRTSIIPQEQAVLLLDQFEATLMDLLAPAGRPAAPLSISKPSLFSILPPACEALPTDTGLLHELLENSALSIPSAVALEFTDDVTFSNNGQCWTYREIDALGNQIAHFITSHGVEPGSIIAACFNKCPVAYFTLLGILKAGCAFLCLDPSAPAKRQTFILDDSKAAMLIICEHFDWASDTSLPVYMIDASMLETFPTSRPLLQRQVFPSDSCYCLYTSGTTGTPKGCLISHENAVQAMAAFKDLFTGRWNPDSRWLQFAALHFDVSILEQYWSWYVGITVVAAPKDVILSDLAMTISKLRITHIDLTPSLARLITPRECPSLCEGVFITGGEKLRSDVLETWGSEKVIYNAYGPTEATIGITMYRGVPENGRPSNIGNLFPNVGAYIFERDTETPVIRGGVGELCVSGKLVGKGYLNREALTKERFPSLASGERIYRTGDLVRVLYDDSLDFLGRADDQVKLRGQRLEIGEINHVIRESLADEASDVVTAVIRRKAQDTDLLVSFVSMSSNSGPACELQVYYDTDHKELTGRAQEACRSRLATYMVPSFILCLSCIPLSTNNKVDMNRLKSLYLGLSHEQLQALSVASSPSSRTLNKDERKLLEAICQVTRAEEDAVIPTTTIFELGIDSITATRLAKQLRGLGFVSATPSVILRHPQIGQLSEVLKQHDFNDQNSHALQVRQSIAACRHRYLGPVCEALEVKPTEVEYIAPCTPLQQGMIARSKEQGSQSSYFNQFQLQLDQRVSIDRLKEGFGRVLAAYSVLRTAFVDTSDGSLQVAMKSRPIRWFEVETTPESFERITAERRRLWVDANHHILKWPVEADHVEVDGQHYLLLRLFHGIYDARSLSIILQSLEGEYEGNLMPRGPEFVSVLAEGPLLKYQESHQFWKSLLKNHHFQPMPSLTGTPSAISSLIHQSMKFDGFEERRKELQVTHQALLQAAWLYTLHQFFVDAPTIGVILSGRSLAIDDIDLVVGPLFNTLPLRVDFTNSMTWVSLARKIQEHNNDILTFSHTPLRDIQKLCANGQPVFDTLFTFDRDEKPISTRESSLWSIQDSPAHPDYPLAVEIIMVEDNIFRVTLAAQGHIADEQALSSLLDQFSKSLASIIVSVNDILVSHTASEDDPKPVLEPRSQSNSYKVKKGSDFVWDEKSSEVRCEVAALAGVDQAEISGETNLFALGLDSIDLIKLSGRLTKLGYNVGLSALMKQPTLESILVGLRKCSLPTMDASSTADLGDVISILETWYRETGLSLSDVEAVLPPTALQDSMVAEMIHSDFHRYFNHDVVQLPPDVDIDSLKSALSTVYASSPILRTSFIEIDDPRVSSAYCQVIRKHQLDLESISRISGTDDISKLTDLARLRALESGGASHLFQVQFAELGSSKLMVLSIAHALYDGWSLDMLHKDIEAAYKNEYIPRIPYKGYLSRIIRQSSSPDIQFWADLLHGAQATIVPKSNMISGKGIIHRHEMQSKRSVSDIRALCKKLRITPQVLSQACWAAVLASLTGSLDVIFGVVLSGRDTREAQELMFPTMNTVPLRLALHGSVIEFLHYSQDIMSSVLEIQHTPLRDIQKFARGYGDTLFNSIFLLQNSMHSEPRSGTFLHSIHSVSAVDYPVCAELELTGKDAIWRVAVNEDYMNSKDIENLGSRLERVLNYFAGNANQPVLKFNSNGPQMVSICGLEPIEFRPKEEEKETDVLVNGYASRTTTLSSQGYETLLDVLSDICKVQRHEIDPRLSIFHIGLDSISAIKASSMLRKRGLEITTRDLLTIPSIGGILEKANQAISERTQTTVPEQLQPNPFINREEVWAFIKRSGLDLDSIETILPALPVQVYMMSIWQNSGGGTFFPKFTFRLSGPIDLVTLSKAWLTVVDEVAMLRTHLVATTSFSPSFLQIILQPKFARQHAKTVTTQRGGRWEFAYAATPFAVAQFIGEQSGEVNLNLCIHHVLYDGISLPMILNRFAELCSSGSPVVDHPKSAPWYEFVLNHLSSPIRAHSESFWTSYLSGCTDTCISRVTHRPEGMHGPRVNEFRRAGVKNAARLKPRGSSHGIPTQALLLAAYSKAFMKWLRQARSLDDDSDYVFGIYLANRSGYPDVEAVPLPTLNIVPLRVRNPLSRSIIAIAADIQKDIVKISVFENSTASLWEVQGWTGVNINTIVNVLATPDDLSFPAPHSVRLEKLPNNNSRALECDDVSGWLIAPDDNSLSPNMLAHSYPEAVDVELALHEKTLDLGIFGPSTILSAAQATDMARMILNEIEEL